MAVYDLQSYKMELHQVEAALITDPENEKLLKLKIDLEEAIELMQDLIKSQQQEQKVEKKDPSKKREYFKKKKQKQLQKFMELDEEREQGKNKWLKFANKSLKKGVIKKSIFATPKNVNGRVGIGTCGVSGKEMTKFTNGEKWRRGTYI